MTIPTVLIILLVGLVVILAVLLTIRIRSERRQSASVRRMNLQEFSEFLRSNSLDGSVGVVAGRVSDLLKHAFCCERIVFLRKHRGFLELSYFYGINRFNRREFRIRYSSQLAEQLAANVFPQPLVDFSEKLPNNLFRRLSDWQFDRCFPIFWRNHLYGVYFIKSNIETQSPSFKLLIASLAHTLSAAYHIKWHEDRYDRLEEKLQTMAAAEESNKQQSTHKAILKLIRHRDSETLVGKIINEVRNDLELERLAFVYESKIKDEPLRLLRTGLAEPLPLPRLETFNELVGRLTSGTMKPVVDLKSVGEESGVWGEHLRQAGLGYVVSFPLSNTRSGLLAWHDGKPPEEVVRRLLRHGIPTAELLENAESFEHVEELSYTDNLTGLSNRRYFVKRLEEEIGRATRYRRSLALIIFDIDELKGINDAYGHQAGDTVIQRMGELLQRSTRSIDVIARYGGDEFCVIMPEADGATCMQFMNRLKEKIVGSKFEISQMNKALHCTISQGGAVFPQHGKTSDELIYSADMALLKAKEAGRNNYLIYN